MSAQSTSTCHEMETDSLPVYIGLVFGMAVTITTHNMRSITKCYICVLTVRG